MNTRIAPSPTGSFHLGTARTAYLNWLAAKSTGGEFILRIDDTDASRNVEGAEDKIIESLEWLGLQPDIIVKQSQRIDRHISVANLLLAGEAIQDFIYGHGTVKEDGAIILKSQQERYSWTDEVIGTVHTSYDDRKISSNIVLIKSNGTPTYMFSSVLDDYDYGIDLIIRGVDHISNTLRQIIIFSLLGKCPKFAHVGLLRQDGKKLSKRTGSKDVLWYRDQGYSPEAILSWLLRHGWSHSDPNYNKPISKSEALDMFWKGHMNAKDSNLDIGKLDWIQRKLKVNE